jgi:Flp pilus assembly pilin Flp
MGNGLGIMLGGGISGSNYVFSPSEWVSLGGINGEAAGDESGISVSLSSNGTIVAIGALGNDGNGSNSGHVRVYQNVAGSWNQIGQDINGEAIGDGSGFSVSLSSDGTIVAIGAHNNDGNGSASGHVRVYENLSGTWTQVGSDIDGEAVSDNSGYSVSLSADGSILAIGANGNDGNGSNSGHVRVYQNVGGTWTQIGSDIDGEASLDFSGRSVSLSSDGSILAIGAWGNDGSGIECWSC